MKGLEIRSSVSAKGLKYTVVLRIALPSGRRTLQYFADYPKKESEESSAFSWFIPLRVFDGANTEKILKNFLSNNYDREFYRNVLGPKINSKQREILFEELQKNGGETVVDYYRFGKDEPEDRSIEADRWKFKI